MKRGFDLREYCNKQSALICRSKIDHMNAIVEDIVRQMQAINEPETSRAEFKTYLEYSMKKLNSLTMGRHVNNFFDGFEFKLRSIQSDVTSKYFMEQFKYAKPEDIKITVNDMPRKRKNYDYFSNLYIEMNHFRIWILQTLDEISIDELATLIRSNLIFLVGFFYPASLRDAALGDMIEFYNKDAARVGSTKATCWMIADVMRSNYPLFKSFMRTKLIKVLKMIGLYHIYKLF